MYVLIGSIFSGIPSFAQTTDMSDSVIEPSSAEAGVIISLLDQSSNQAEQKIQELDENGMEVSDNIDNIYQKAVAEQKASLIALENGEMEAAQEHALAAMSLFGDVVGDLSEQAEIKYEGNTTPFELVETISNAENTADEIRTLVSVNNLDISFAEYDASVEQAKEFLLTGDLASSSDLLETAEQSLGTVYDQLDETR
jgi:hypothetical protein